MVQKLKFGIYDIDNKTIDLGDDDFLGELECTLGQVRGSLPVSSPVLNTNERVLLLTFPAIVRTSKGKR